MRFASSGFGALRTVRCGAPSIAQQQQEMTCHLRFWLRATLTVEVDEDRPFWGPTALQSQGGAARCGRRRNPCVYEYPPSTRLRTDSWHARGYRALHSAPTNPCVRGLRFLAPSRRSRRFCNRRYILRVLV